MKNLIIVALFLPCLLFAGGPPSPVFASASRTFVASETDLIDLGAGGGIAATHSITFWINPVAISAYAVVAIAPNGGDINAIEMGTSGTGEIQADISHSAGSGTGRKAYNGATVLSSHTWHHVGITWDGTDLEIYLNGVADTPYNKIVDTDVSQTETTRTRTIGYMPHDTRRVFDGEVASVRIYTVALSAAQMVEIASGNINAETADLFGHYLLQESGDIFRNLSGSGLTGANTGTVVSADGPAIFHPGGI